MDNEQHTMPDKEDTALPTVFLGDIPDGAFITEEALAALLLRHPSTLRRAIERGELCSPVSLLNRRIFNVGKLRGHLLRRLEAAEEDQRAGQEMMEKHRP